MKYGEFVDAMREVAKINPDAECIFADWHDMATEEQWREYRDLPLGKGEAQNFIEDMASSFRSVINGTCGKDLYEERIKNGHDFLQAVKAKCAELELGFKVGNIDVPFTFSDALRGMIAQEE